MNNKEDEWIKTENGVELSEETDAYKSLNIAMEWDLIFQDQIIPMCKKSAFTKHFFQTWFEEYLDEIKNIVSEKR